MVLLPIRQVLCTYAGNLTQGVSQPVSWTYRRVWKKEQVILNLRLNIREYRTSGLP